MFRFGLEAALILVLNLIMQLTWKWLLRSNKHLLSAQPSLANSEREPKIVLNNIHLFATVLCLAASSIK